MSEIKVDGMRVRAHTQKFRTGKTALHTKGTSTSAHAGRTNYAGFKAGIACRGRMSSIISVLSVKIGDDCTNVECAADAINGMDLSLSMQMNNLGSKKIKLK